MEKIELTINNDYINVLNFALYDKELRAIDFKTLFYIVQNLDFILVEKMKKELNIKTNNLMSSCLSTLIKNNYITRFKTPTVNKKGFPFYQYSINTNKPLLPKNNNSMIYDNYFNSINEIFIYFFKVIPTVKKIDVLKSKKAIELMIFKDDFSILDLKNIINNVSLNPKFKNISRPYQLRQLLKNQEILKELINKDI